MDSCNIVDTWVVAPESSDLVLLVTSTKFDLKAYKSLKVPFFSNRTLLSGSLFDSVLIFYKKRHTSVCSSLWASCRTLAGAFFFLNLLVFTLSHLPSSWSMRLMEWPPCFLSLDASCHDLDCHDWHPHYNSVGEPVLVTN